MNFPKWKTPQSLQFALLVPLTLLIMGLSGFQAYYWESQTGHLLEHWDSDNSTDIIGATSIALETLPRDRLDRFFAGLAASRGILHLSVSLESTHAILFSSGFPGKGQTLDQQLSGDDRHKLEELLGQQLGATTWKSEGRFHFLERANVLLEGDIQSTPCILYVVLDDSRHQEHLVMARQTGWTNMIISALTLMITTVGLLQWNLFRPLEAILKTINLWKTGDLEARIPRGPANEIGKICTTLNQTMADLQSATFRLKEALGATRDGIIDWDLENRLVDLDERSWDLFGLPGEPLPRPMNELLDIAVHPDHSPEVAKILAGIKQSDSLKTFSFDLPVRTKHHTKRWLSVRGSLFSKGQGDHCYRFVGLVSDFTSLKNAQIALEGQATRLDLALKAGRLGLYDLDVVSGRAVINQRYAEMLGYDPATFEETNDAWRSRLHPSEMGSLFQTYDDYIHGRIPEYQVEFRNKTSRGKWIWIRSTGTAVSWDSQGKVTRMIGIHEDITEAKLLRDRESLRLAILENPQVPLRSRLVPLVNHFEKWVLDRSLVIILHQLHGQDLVVGSSSAMPWSMAWSSLELDSRVVATLWQELGREWKRLDRFQSSEIVRSKWPDGLARAILSEGYTRLEIQPLFGEKAVRLATILVFHRGQDTGESNAPEEIEVIRTLATEALNASHMQEAIRESEQRFRTLVEEAPEPIFIQTRGKYAFANKATLQLLGAKRPEDLLGTEVLDRFEGLEKEMVRKRIQQLNQLKSPVPLRRETIHKLDGTPTPIEVIGVPFRFEGEDGALVFMRDITERLQAEEAIRKSEEQFRSLFLSAGEGIVIADPQTQCVTLANPAACKLFGYSEREIIGLPVEKLHPSWAHPQLNDHFQYILEGKYRINREMPCVTRDGTLFFCDITPTTMELGEEKRIFGFFNDVTETKKAFEALKQKEKALVETQELAKIGGFEWSLETQKLTLSSQLGPVLGFESGQELDTEGIVARVHPDDVEALRGWMSSITEIQAENTIHEFRYESPQQGLKHLVVRAKRIQDENGRVERVVGTIQDISDRARLAEEIKQNNLLFEGLFQSSVVGVIITNIHKRQITKANATFLEMTGYRPEDLPINWEGMTPPEWAEKDNEVIALLESGKIAPPWEKEYFRKDGSRLPILIGVTVLPSVPNHQIAFVIDISERIQREQEIRRQAWMVGERVKEQRCIFKMSQLFDFSSHQDDLEHRLAQVPALLAEAFHYPKRALGRIQFEEFSFASHADQKADQELSATINLKGKPVGVLAVGYTQPFPKSPWTEDLFLPEEETLLKTLAIMIGNRIEAHEAALEVQSSEGQLRALYETSPQGIVQADPLGNLIGANPSFLRIFGYTHDSIKGVTIRDLHPPEIFPRVKETFDSMARGILEPVRSLPCLRSDGATILCDITPTLLVLDGQARLVAYFTDVTAQVEADRALAKSRRDLEKAQVVAKMGSWVYDLQTKKYEPSREFLDLIEWKGGELGRDSLRASIHPDDLPGLLYKWKEADKGKPYEHEIRVKNSASEYRWMRTIAEPQFNEEGKVVEIIGITQDIHEKKMAADKLFYQAELLRETGELARLGTWELGKETTDLALSPVAAAIFGAEPQNPLNKESFTRAFSVDPTAELERCIAEALDKRRPFDIESKITTLKGQERWVRILGSPVTDRGRVHQIRGLVQDITERIRDRQALERERTLFRSILTQVPDAVWFKDTEGHYRFCNEHFENLIGRREEEILGRFDEEFSDPAGSQRYRQRDREAMESDTPLVYQEWRTNATDGRRNLLEIRKVATYDQSGQIIGVLGLARDITLQEEARETLIRFNKELENRVVKRTQEIAARQREFEAVVQSIPDTVIRLTHTGQVVFCKPSSDMSQSWCTQCGGRGCDTVRCTVSGLIEVALEIGRALVKTGGSGVVEREFSGTFFELRVSSLADGDFLVLVRDVSARRKLEEEIKNALAQEKQLSEMKSRFISVASHEFRTPMAAVTGSVDLLQNFSDRLTPTKRNELLDRIVNGANRLKSIVDDVLMLSRVDAGRVQVNKAPTNLEEFLKDVVGEAEVGDTKKHIFETTLEGDVLNLVTDTKLLHHIVSNLLSNAIRYSPPETRIQVSLKRTGSEYRFRIQDEGIGVPENDREHLFEPFFRAGNVGTIGGTGLGLNIVKRYTELLGGNVALLPSEKGACFEITLPVEGDSGAPKT